MEYPCHFFKESFCLLCFNKGGVAYILCVIHGFLYKIFNIAEALFIYIFFNIITAQCNCSSWSCIIIIGGVGVLYQTVLYLSVWLNLLYYVSTDRGDRTRSAARVSIASSVLSIGYLLSADHDIYLSQTYLTYRPTYLPIFGFSRSPFDCSESNSQIVAR